MLCHWGDGFFQDEETEASSTFQIISTVITFRKVSCGQQHILLLSSQHRLFVMGSNDKGQLGMTDNTVFFSKPTAIMKNEKILEIASGWYHNAVVNSEKLVYSWGNAAENQPKKMNIHEKIDNVYCGARHTIFKSQNDTLYGIGDNQHGQLGLPLRKYNQPELINTVRTKSIACGTSHTLLLDLHGDIYASGLNNFGQLGTGKTENFTKFTNIKCSLRFLGISCGHHSAGISENNELYLWGTGPFGNFKVPTKMGDMKIKKLWMGNTFGFAQTVQGQIYSWGSNTGGQLGHGNTSARQTIDRIHPPLRIEQLACGGRFVMSIGEARRNEIVTVPTHESIIETKRNKPIEILLSQQKFMQTSIRIEHGHKKSLELINQQLRRKLTETTQQLSLKKLELRISEQQLEQLSMHSNQLHKVNGQLTEQVLNLQNTINQMNETYRLETELEEQHKKNQMHMIKERQNQIILLHRQIMQLTSKNTQIQKYVEQLKEQLRSIRLPEPIPVVQPEISQQLISKIYQKDKTIESYILECYGLKTQSQRQKQQIQQLQEANSILLQRTDKLEEANVELTKQLSMLKLSIASNGSIYSQPVYEGTKQTDIELHNYKKLLSMKDREVNQLKKLLNSHRESEITTTVGVTVSQCVQSLRIQQYLEESHGKISIFRQLLRDLDDHLQQLR